MPLEFWSKIFELTNEKSVTPLDAASSIQYSVDSHGKFAYRKNLKADLQFYRQGVQDFHKTNPAYRFTGAYGKQEKGRYLLRAQGKSKKPELDLDLFERDGSQARDYDTKISQLRKNPEGTILRFTGDHGEVYRFKLLSFISSGKTTAVFRAKPLSNDLNTPSVVALRVPIGIEVREEGERSIPAQEFINETIQGYSVLAKGGVTIPKMVSHADGQFVASELVPHDFDGVRFFSHPETISPGVLQEADQALEKFAVTLRKFKRIGDFSPDQIVYNAQSKKWTLLDYLERHTERATLFSKETPFDDDGFKKALTDPRKQSKNDRPKLSAREEKLLSRLSQKIHESRSLPPGSVACPRQLLENRRMMRNRVKKWRTSREPRASVLSFWLLEHTLDHRSLYQHRVRS